MACRGQAGGDIDHLVVFGEYALAFAVEAKTSITQFDVHGPAADIATKAATAQQISDLEWVDPVLCSVRGGWRRGFTRGVLIADADALPAALTWPVAEFAAFRAGDWRFPEHRSAHRRWWMP